MAKKAELLITHGCGEQFTELCSIKAEYTGIKRNLKSLVDRKIDRDCTAGAFNDALDALLKNMNRIKIGALVNRMTAVESRYNELTDESVKAKARVYIKELYDYIYTVIATFDRFAGVCYQLMCYINSERVDYSSVRMKIDKAAVGVNPCIAVVSRASLNEIFEKIEKLFEDAGVKEAEEVTDEAPEAVTTTDTQYNASVGDSDSVSDADSTSYQTDVQNAVGGVSGLNTDVLSMVMIEPSEEDVQRLKEAI